MNWPLLIWNVHLAATWYMVGLIWFVHVVHYPQFDGVGADRWADYHRRHLRGTTFVVAPVMLVELATAIAILFARPLEIGAGVAWTGLGFLAIVWLSTFARQVPRHNELADGFDAISHARLCRSNLWRAILWTARGVLLLAATVWAASTMKT